MSKVIGIAGNRLIEAIDYLHGNPADYTQTELVLAFQKCGAIPLILPIDDPKRASLYIEQIDVLALAGGQDIDPLFYGEEPIPTLEGLLPIRDAFEIALVKEAIRQGKAVFGLCRGMQIINVALGGTLVQDVNQLKTTHLKHLQAPTKECFKTHHITVKDEAMMREFLPSSYTVNSYHHQAVKQLADGLHVTAVSPDDLIEGFEDKVRRILGVQWHPETLWASYDEEMTLFKYIVEKL
ncbi:MAG: gamma-glutamyl-gamma-aminobutyrate hydrolase family protein [Streptococcaceae bacterium]|jgi:putative glutamine amidotransferase|nr:gamma-glutamyl-gamma-aminobutyrate hydrolase family protein [Streptococcaceae bacterium]